MFTLAKPKEKEVNVFIVLYEKPYPNGSTYLETKTFYNRSDAELQKNFVTSNFPDYFVQMFEITALVRDFPVTPNPYKAKRRDIQRVVANEN